MSDVLTNALATADPGEVADLQHDLRAAGAAALDARDPSAVLYAALADALEVPDRVEHTRLLMAECESVEALRPGAVMATTQDLLARSEDQGRPELVEALADALIGAELERQRTVEVLTARAGDTVPPDWTPPAA